MELKGLLEFYNNSKKLESQFILFFMPLSMNKTLKNSTIEKDEQPKENNQFSSQRIMFNDLNKNPEKFKKFKKFKTKDQITLAFRRINDLFSKKLRTPLIIQLHYVQIIVIKILLLLLFTFQWVKKIKILF